MTTHHDARPELADDQRPSIGELLSDVSANLSELMRQELELAKAELRQTVTGAGKGAGLLGGAATAAHLMLLFASVAAWWAIGNSTGRGWSALIVAATWAAVALVLGLLGRQKIREVDGLPRTTDTVKRIPDALKGDEPGHRDPVIDLTADRAAPGGVPTSTGTRSTPMSQEDLR
jgi:hypothetical protein